MALQRRQTAGTGMPTLNAAVVCERGTGAAFCCQCDVESRCFSQERSWGRLYHTRKKRRMKATTTHHRRLLQPPPDLPPPTVGGSCSSMSQIHISIHLHPEKFSKKEMRLKSQIKTQNKGAAAAGQVTCWAWLARQRCSTCGRASWPSFHRRLRG